MKTQRIIGVSLFAIGIILDFFIELLADEIKKQPLYIQNRNWILFVGAIFILIGIFLTIVNIPKLKEKILKDDEKGVGDITFLNKDLNFLQEQVASHQENLKKLLNQKSTYAKGEEPLHLLNQIEAEEKKIKEIKQQLQKSGA